MSGSDLFVRTVQILHREVFLSSVVNILKKTVLRESFMVMDPNGQSVLMLFRPYGRRDQRSHPPRHRVERYVWTPRNVILFFTLVYKSCIHKRRKLFYDYCFRHLRTADVENVVLKAKVYKFVRRSTPPFFQRIGQLPYSICTLQVIQRNSSEQLEHSHLR